MATDSPWLTAKEAAARAQVSISVIYHEVQAGRLRAAHIGGRRDLRFREAYIDAWLDQSAKGGIVHDAKPELLPAWRRA
jgi:excisionase family DNA binding protein